MGNHDDEVQVGLWGATCRVQGWDPAGSSKRGPQAGCRAGRQQAAVGAEPCCTPCMQPRHMPQRSSELLRRGAWLAGSAAGLCGRGGRAASAGARGGGAAGALQGRGQRPAVRRPPWRHTPHDQPQRPVQGALYSVWGGGRGGRCGDVPRHDLPQRVVQTACCVWGGVWAWHVSSALPHHCATVPGCVCSVLLEGPGAPPQPVTLLPPRPPPLVLLPPPLPS